MTFATAPPAPAAQFALDLGGLSGAVEAGKNGVCEDDGSGWVSGGGLGIPVLSGVKWGHWRLEAEVVSALYGSGFMQICGKFGPFGRGENAIGAACGGPAKLYDGKGSIVYGFGGLTFSLWDVGFKPDRGQLIGRAAINPSKNQGTFYLRKWGGEGSAECWFKTSEDKSAGQGGTWFPLVAGYHVNPLFSVGMSDFNNHPSTCKDSSNPACPYETKR